MQMLSIFDRGQYNDEDLGLYENGPNDVEVLGLAGSTLEQV